jgi:hypothetical protein
VIIVQRGYDAHSFAQLLQGGDKASEISVAGEDKNVIQTPLQRLRGSNHAEAQVRPGDRV